MPSFKLVQDKYTSDELMKRFNSEIAFLEAEGFSPFSLHQEIIYPFSVLIFFPIYLAMRSSNELIRIQHPLRITSFHLIYTSQNHSTYAYIYGLGCKFYTNFTDGTWLVSNTSLKIKKNTVMILKKDFRYILPIQIWERHQEKISELEAQGKRVNPHIAFDDWVKLEQQFEKGYLPSVIAEGFIWLMFVSSILYWLISELLSIISAG